MALIPVKVTGGAAPRLVGKTGYLDEKTQWVYFQPETEPPDRGTKFKDAEHAARLELRKLTKKEREGAKTTQRDGGVDVTPGAFR